MAAPPYEKYLTSPQEVSEDELDHRGLFPGKKIGLRKAVFSKQHCEAKKASRRKGANNDRASRFKKSTNGRPGILISFT